MAGYNQARFVQDLLQKTEGKPPSFTVNLYPDYWSLNGSRFNYHIQMAVRVTLLSLRSALAKWLLVPPG